MQLFKFWLRSGVITKVVVIVILCVNRSLAGHKILVMAYRRFSSAIAKLQLVIGGMTTHLFD